MTTKTLSIAIDPKLAVSGAEQVSRSLRDIQAQAAATIKSTEAMVASFAKLGTSAANLNSMLKTIGSSAEFSKMAAGVNAFEQSLSRTRSSAAATAAEIERMEKAGRGLSNRPTTSPTRPLPSFVMPRPTGVSDFNAELERGVKSSGSLTSAFSRLAIGAGGLNGILATMGLSAGFSQMVNTLATFEKTLSGVKAVTKASAEEMERMNKAARQLGATTAFSATQAAQGMTMLGQAGFSTSEIITAMEPVLNLAAAGTMDLGKAAEIAGGIMGGFRLKAGDMGMIADVLAAAAASGAVDLADLGNSMKYVGPVAASLGVSLQDTAAAMVVLSNSGIKGEQAGTALRGILASILDPSKEAEKDIKKLGLTFDQISPKTNTLAQIFEKLRVAGIDTAYAYKLFGQEGASSVSILTANTQALEKQQIALKNVSGEAKRMAETMMDNLKGDWDELTGAAEELTLQIGEAGLLGGLRALTQTATGVVRVFAGMDESLGDQAGYYRTLAAAVEGLAVAMGSILIARALTPLVARSAEAVVGLNGLTAAVTASARATAAVAASDNIAAAAAVAKAQANVAAAQAQIQSAMATDKATGSVVAQRAALAQLAVANAELASAKVAATAAETAHGAALVATSVRARAAAGAMKLLTGALAFFGGPVGLAITALGAAIYYVSTRTTEAEKTQKIYNERMSKMQAISAELITASGARREELEAERQQILKNIDAEYALAEAKLKALTDYKASGQTSVADKVDSGLKSLDSALGFQPTGIDPIAGALKSADEMAGFAPSPINTESTDKQIADQREQLKKLSEDREKFRAEANKSNTSAAAGPGLPPAKPPPAGGGDDQKESVLRRYKEQMLELQQQEEAVRRLNAAYAEGPEAVERETKALDLLNERQKLNAQFTAQQTENLMKHVESLYGAEKAAGVSKEIFNMDMAIRSQSDMNKALKDGHDAEQSAQYAAEARAKAIELGVVGDQQSIDVIKSRIAVLDQERKYSELLRDMRARGEAIGDSKELADAYLKEGDSVRVAEAAIEARNILIAKGLPLTAANIQQLTDQIAKQQQVNQVLQENRRIREGGFDLEQGYAEIEQLNLTGEAYYTANERLNMLMQKKRETGDTTATLTEQEEELARALGNMAYQSAIANDALSQMGRQTQTVQQTFRDATAQGLGHFEDALVDIVTGAKSAREAFADMAKSIAADLARMAIKMAIIQPLAMMFGGMGGGMAAPVFGGFMSSAAAGPITWAHTGGVVGADSLKTTNPMMSWPKFHTGGLAANETPAVLMKGEGVFTKEQMKALSPVNNNSGGNTIVNNINVTAPQGGSQAGAENQANMIAKMVSQAVDERLTQNLRPGGILNNNGGAY